jgi:hypothetical protein
MPRSYDACRRAVEDPGVLARLVSVKLNLFITVAALALLVLALGGWVVQSIRRPPISVTPA